MQPARIIGWSEQGVQQDTALQAAKGDSYDVETTPLRFPWLSRCTLQFQAWTQRLKVLDLRSSNPNEEALYKQSLEGEVLHYGFAVSLACAIAIPCAIGPVYAREESRIDDPFSFRSPDVRSWFLIIWCLTFLAVASFTFTSALRIYNRLFMRWNWELYFTSVATLLSLSLSLVNYWHLPLLSGHDPLTIWEHDPRGAEVYVLLALDCILTATAMYVPVRACVMWILPVVGIGSYVFILAFVATVYPNDRLLTIGALLVLTFLAQHGAIRNEIARREKFQVLIRVQEAEEAVQEQNSQIAATSALVNGLRNVADSLCDLLIELTSDLEVSGAERMHNAWFEQEMEGRKFTDVLEERDKSRFMAFLKLVTKNSIPACLPVTIRRRENTSECHLLLVDTGRHEPRYLLGIRVEADHARSVRPSYYRSLEPIEHAPQIEEFLGLVPAVENIGSRGLNSDNLKRMICEDSDFSFTTYPKNMPPPPPLFTPIKARALSLRKLMPRWNIPRDPDSCCQLHTIIRSLSDVAEFLEDSACDPLFSTLESQCPRCKCMCTEGWQKCVVCGAQNHDRVLMATMRAQTPGHPPTSAASTNGVASISSAAIRDLQ